MRAFGLALVCSSLGLLAALCGCAADDRPFVAKNEFAAQYAAAICGDLAPCCASAALAYDVAACEKRISDALSPRLSDPALVYDPAAAAECVLAAAEASHGCFEGDASAFVGACDRVLIGTVAEGAACTSPNECALPLRGGHASCAAGKCVVVKAGSEGEACAFTCTKSGGGERCSSTAPSPDPKAPICFTATGVFCSAGACAPLARIGEPCTKGGCLDGAYCASDGRCAALGGAGVACARDDGCAFGARCRGGKCVELAHAGASCASDDACGSGRCAAGKCGASSSITATLCGGAVATPDPGDGGS